MEVGIRPRLLEALAREGAGHPFARKLLVCRRHGAGRELLRALARTGVPWIGWEVTTPLALALDVVAEEAAVEGWTVVDEFEGLALLDEAMDGVLGGVGGRLAELAEGVGLRQAVAAAVQALRLSGIGPAALRSARLRDVEKRDALAAVLATYEELLRSRRRLDVADVFFRAAAAVTAGAGLSAERVYLLPGHDGRGLAGGFLSAMIGRGAKVLPAEEVHGLAVPASPISAEEPVESQAPPRLLAWLHAPADAPAAAGGTEVDLFAAASVGDELREVLRRVLAAGLAWDEVEIVASDPVAYGAALDGIARRLSIPVTYAVGLPFERTRAGRALRGYLRWIREDFPDDALRALLMSGDVAPPDACGVSGSGLARRLRRLRIGRGRNRYMETLSRARHALSLPRREDDEREPEEVAAALLRETRELDALAGILEPVLAATPAMPGRSGGEGEVAPAAIAAGALALLRFVPVREPVEAIAHTRLSARLGRLAQTAHRQTSAAAAVALLLAKVDTRVPGPDAEGAAPWSSAGGHLHLSDVVHGGLTRRRATFIVGLDSARFPGGGVQDALLGDDDRRALRRVRPDASLATTAERLEERRYELASLLARLNGRVTLSYAAWEPAEARMVAPAAEVLQAFRLVRRDPAADYDAMHASRAGLASAVPGGAARLDASDVWLAALAGGGRMRRGDSVVREAFRPLDRGLRALAARLAPELSAHHGLVSPRAALDPRRRPGAVAIPRPSADARRRRAPNGERRPGAVVSASRLESLGICPRRYFLRYVLGVRPPEDPDLQPDRWLSPLDRGSLLHAVYERSLRLARDRAVPPTEPAFGDVALGVLEQEVGRWRDLLPPPGRAVYEVEVNALRRDVVVFAHMLATAGADWIALEHRFGRGGAEPPVEVALPSGATIQVAGAIDRIDRRAEGLVVIDYKTGSPYDYERRSGIYRGGRRLQHVLYRAIAEQLFGEPVLAAEYHFPTEKARNHVAAYTHRELDGGLGVVERLLDLAAQGLFIPTPDPADCRFCDFREICRVRVTDSGTVTSPPAEWSRKAVETLPELEPVRELRCL